MHEVYYTTSFRILQDLFEKNSKIFSDFFAIQKNICIFGNIADFFEISDY